MVRWSGRGCTGRCGLFGAADEDADGFVVVLSSEYIVHEGDVEVEFAGAEITLTTCLVRLLTTDRVSSKRDAGLWRRTRCMRRSSLALL